MNENVKEWYINAYPSDELGESLKDGVTFWDVFNTLDAYEDVYGVVGIGDSLVRERIFERLAELMEVDYDYIYEKWMRCY